MAHDATTEEMTTLSIRLPRALKREWARRAQADGRMLSAWVRRMVELQIRPPEPTATEVRERMAEGEPLHAIEQDLDRRDNAP